MGFKGGRCVLYRVQGGGIGEDKEHEEKRTRGELPNCDSCHKQRISLWNCQSEGETES